jgi:hypothetical protein
VPSSAGASRASHPAPRSPVSDNGTS